MEEIWKPCKYYEDRYEVSTLGRVRNINTKQIKAQSDNGKGYQKITIDINGKTKNEYVHRLVALTFIPNPDNLPQVNHKDEDKANNFVENLEWCDNDYNAAYGTRGYRQGQTLLNNGKTSSRVIKCDMKGNEIQKYRSMREAERENNLANGVISKYFKQGWSQIDGYTWKLEVKI